MATCIPHLHMVHATRDKLRAALVLLGALIVLVGCNTPLPAQQPLMDLHLPGVTQISGITALPGPAGIISAVSAYSPADTTAPTRVVLVRDGQLLDVGLAGGPVVPLRMPAPCGRSDPVGLSASANGQWVACDSFKGIELTALSAASPDGGRLILSNTPGHYVIEPAWSPDGQHLAVMDDVCTNTIDLFTLSPAFDRLRLTAQVRLVAPGATTAPPPGCEMFTLAWSPDGAWLALLRGGKSGFVAYGLSMATYLPQLPAFDAEPVVRAVALDRLVRLTPDGLFDVAPAWSRSADTLAVTFVTDDGRVIAQAALGSTQSKTLLRVPEGYVSALAWTLDGQHLVFAVSVVPCADCRQAFTPSHLYVYTPSP